MALLGLHHVTCLTADAPGTVRFYRDVLGLRLVKRTVNFDEPSAYHLYFGDERGTPGTLLTFFVFPDAGHGRAGAGMVWSVRWAVGSAEALGFWALRLAEHGVDLLPSADGRGLRFAGPDRLTLELAVDAAAGLPRGDGERAGVPAAFALRGLAGVRARVGPPGTGAAARDLDPLGPLGAGYELDEAAPGPAGDGVPGSGTVDHIAWACEDLDELERWGDRLVGAGLEVTPIRDRQWFRSIYFRLPHGVLFEIATRGPGFTVDEDLAHLGGALSLPPRLEPLRAALERRLPPLP